jgi:hypothetical protein
MTKEETSYERERGQKREEVKMDEAQNLSIHLRRDCTESKSDKSLVLCSAQVPRDVYTVCLDEFDVPVRL